MTEKREVEQVGCFPWLVYIGLLFGAIIISIRIGDVADGLENVAQATEARRADA